MSYGSAHDGPSQDEFEEIVREFERDQVKLSDRIDELQAEMRRKVQPGVTLNPRAFVSVQDHNRLCDDVDDLRGIIQRQGALLRCLIESVHELHGAIEQTSEQRAA